jgi:hypothetical protein
MLDPWIIEEIRRREEELRRQQERRPALEIQIETPRYVPDRDRSRDEQPSDRGVAIIDFRIC